MKRWALLATFLLLAGAANARLELSVHVTRTSFDLLDALAISVAVDNPNGPQSLRFPSSAEYVIEVARGSHVLWTSPTPGGETTPHSRPFPSGLTPLGTFEWSAVLRDGSSPSPGDYTITARLLADHTQPSASARVRFIAPLPITAIAHLKPGDEITVGGTVDASLQLLTDATGHVALSRRLTGAANTPVVVRGSIATRPDGSRYLDVARWATVQPAS